MALNWNNTHKPKCTMKKQILLFTVTVIALLFSCNQNQNNEQGQSGTNQDLKAEAEQVYLYASNGDTILLAIKTVEDSIVGNLILPFEKDSRIGTISSGHFKGDTLYAIFNSTQEGQNLECEIAFLKKDSSYIFSNDIYGEENYQYNTDYTKGGFKNRSVIKFDGELLNLITKNSM